MTIVPAIFRQYDVRGVVGDDLTAETAAAIGRAFAVFLERRGVRRPVAVGRDNRPSGGALRDALVRGLTSCGVDVVDIGIVPTPLLYWSLSNLHIGAGIQITGSHNPAEYNGFKICVGTDSVHGEEIQELRRLAEGDAFPGGHGSVRHETVIERYVDDVVGRTGRMERPPRVVIDCGNGAGSLVAQPLFDRLGVQAKYLFCESDGTFPNHHPDPTVVENLQDLIREVKRDRYDFGVAFDGDADRIGVVDANGRIIWGDYLLILYARDVLARTGAGQPIIFDVKCSQALPDAVRAAGGTPVMWKTGHSLIKEKMKIMHAPIAGEMSGHMFFAESFYGHDDALYGAARLMRIVSESGKRLDELLADVPQFVSTPEIRLDCPDELKFSIVDDAVRHFSSTREVVGVDGARVLFGDGWGLIRASNTQPVLVARFEASTPERLDEIRTEMEGWLRTRGVRV
ncbi:MAG TPA: phosphomannomutase/phosphoglucomutase [Gemmatimonadaceae bacterium]|jgi:phosphomannomutase/phosphoglucomutase|nr:phosphomannomutase/phosphoglucomutase [Gemmatimonadaceae bacterium]